MRLSHPLFDTPGFSFSAAPDLWRALERFCDEEELVLVTRLMEDGLPPITSRIVLSVLLGINPGLIWSFEKRTPRHYREFTIKKGKKERVIHAPRVALKVVQKWLSIVLSARVTFPSHVYGFVPGRSHIEAASKHLGSAWIFSVDIKHFFQTTPQSMVQQVFESLGYPVNGAKLLGALTCLNGYLAQGAPSSPVLSNLCFAETDRRLIELANILSCRMTRYADDIVFSGSSEPPPSLEANIFQIFNDGPWELAKEKTLLQKLPFRLKVHGLLVDNSALRLTKGYRNKLRAFAHVLKVKDLSENDEAKLKGHISYGNHVDQLIHKLKQSEDWPESG